MSFDQLFGLLRAQSRRLAVMTVLVSACGGGSGSSSLRGDWDWYQMLGATPTGGFEARRRFAFAHFESNAETGAWLKRRSGVTMGTIRGIRVSGDSVVLELQGMRGATSFRAVQHGDTIGGLLFDGSTPTNRVTLVRRSSAADFEPPYTMWKGPLSDSTFAMTIDTAVPMHARDGTRLMSFVGRPVGDGPFGVVMERTPYIRFDTTAARFWASRGYIYVKQDVRGRGSSDGILDTNAGQIEDGFDAVEWAAKLPGANGKVGMIGRSNPGLYAWYAAIAQPPHLAAIAPAVATADPIRIVPYIDMVFSPTFVPWLCLTAIKDKNSDMSDVAEVRAFMHLPVIDADTVAGCPRRQFWLDWFDHQTQDAYWKRLGVENQLNKVKVPVLGIAGWHDDARGTIRNYEVMSRLPAHPPLRVVMEAGAHKGIDYVDGHFGPTARLDSWKLQLRWFDHWLKGIDNGVEREAPLDLFIIGDNAWRQESEWPLARTRFTKFYVHSSGHAQTTAGGGTLDTIAPMQEPADTFTYNPANPTPYLVDARELELSLNEDYQAVHNERHDLLVFTSAPLTTETEVTGPMTATVWAATDARDTDWHVMILDVAPDGKAMRIQDGIMRARFRSGFDRVAFATPGTPYRYDIDLWFTGRVIPAGHSLRVSIGSAAFPKYDRNLNTGGDNERDTTFVSAHQRVLHDAQHPTFVTLPIIPRTK
ncbi:MAG: CocE/NonD family hydrolase [Gemmatimonadaceae bacterium]